MFEHDFLPSCGLIQVNNDDGRHYLTPDGLRLRSVTRVLEENQSKSKRQGLKNWRRRVGEEKAARILTQAGKRGTVIHNALEKFLMNDPDYLKGVMPINVETINKITPVIQKNIGMIYALEHMLYSELLMAAGTTDCIGMWDRALSIIDFKTSRKDKPKKYIHSYFLQATAYALMCVLQHDVFPKQIVIVMAVDFEKEPRIFIEPIDSYIQEVLNLFNNVEEAA